MKCSYFFRKAVDEILREIKLKSIRAEAVGPSGWLDAPVKRTNKRFLGNTLKAAVKHNTRKADREKFQSEKKLLEMDYDKHPSRRPKFGDRKFIFKKPSSANDSKQK